MAANPLMDVTDGPLDTRSLGDVDATRKLIYDNALESTRTLPAVSNQRYSLRLVDPSYEGPDGFTKAEEKRAILERRSLGRRIRGTWQLTTNDLEPQVIDEKRATIATIPHMTPRGTFILNGNEYGLSHQMRLRPGIFTRVKESGELESHVNVAKGYGHRYFLDPETGIFRIQFGQARLPMYPVLRALGASDKQIRDAWGNDLHSANAAKTEPQALRKLYKKLTHKNAPDSEEELHTAIRRSFDEMELDPAVTQRTLGKAYYKVNPEVMLSATSKLLRVHNNEEGPDDRDALAYQRTMGPEDLIAERIHRGAGDVRRALWKATFPGNLQRMPPGVLENAVKASILKSGLGNPLEEINPAELYDQRIRVTRLGEGGIPSTDAVPDEARNVQPSYLGFVDPVHTPESGKLGIDSRLAIRTLKGKDGRLYSRFMNPRSGKVEWKSPQDLADATVAFPGEMESNEPFVRAQKDGHLAFVPRAKVDYQLAHMTETFGPLASLVPLKPNAFAQRVSMGSRMITQALPLTDAEAPLVQSGVPGTNNESFESLLGKEMGAMHSEVDGTVMEVTPDYVKIRGQDRRVHYVELYNNHPYNRKSVTGSTSIIIRRQSGVMWEGHIADYAHEERDRVLSIDPVTKQSTWAVISAFVVHANDKKLFRIRTRSGRFVDITEDHSLVTVGDNGELQPLFPADCIINRDRLPVAMCTTCLPIKQVSEEFATLVGLYLAEGHLPEQAGMVMLAVEPDDRAEQVLQLLIRLGLRPYRSGGCVCFTDHAIRAQLLALCGKTSGAKFIAAEMLTWCERARWALIAGYFAGDGCLNADTHGAIQVAAVSTSRALRDGIANMLSTLGIFVTFFDAPRQHLNENWADAYGLRVISGHLAKLPCWFFYTDRERLFRQLLAAAYRSSPYELVPIRTRNARKALYAEFEDVPAYVHKTAHAGAVAKHRLRDCKGNFGAWGNSDVLWDTVVSIEQIEHEAMVYDLCVPVSEVFAVNGGLVVHNTFVHNTALVKPGDIVKPGQLLASSNFTDKNGVTALGKNLRVGYMAYKGHNYEDATVMSESCAKKMASEHMYQHELELGDDVKASKNTFVSIFPGQYDRKILEKYDEDGVIKPGTEVNMDEPLMLAVKEFTQGPRLGRRKSSWSDASIKWEHHAPGIVTDIHKGRNGISVVVKTLNPTQVGDKFAGRYGDKGVVSAIVPDDEMPVGEDGKPFDMLLNPLGVISRANPSQIIEAQLGKVAIKTGQAYRLPDFDSIKDMREFAEQELRKHGMQSSESVVDPVTGRVIKGVTTGHRFMMKLHHTAEAKIQGRSTGGYTAEGSPAKGGAEGSKRVGMLDLNALLSHGAYNTIRDASVIRGQKNEDYWRQLMSGYTPPNPKVPFVYEKFLAQLQGAGINPIKNGTKMNIMALTNKDVRKMTENRELQNTDTVDWRLDKLTPKKGGLFDPGLTGGHDGNRWSYIALHEPVPNPVMEEPIRRILGLTGQQFEDIITGKAEIPGRPGLQGPLGLKTALDNFNVDAELAKAQQEAVSGKKTYRDKALGRLSYLKNMQRLGQHPSDWMLDRVPVMPPIYRPVSLMGNTGTQLVTDANYLYKELWDSNDNLKKLADRTDDVSEERLNVYNAFKGITGLGDPIRPENKEQDIKGILKHVFGTSPKFGVVQRKLLGSTVDLVGRATITPNPNLDMDQVGLPIDKAWTLYQPFVVRRLVRRGMGKVAAMEAVKGQTPAALKELQEEMQVRPVIINRAPVLHRYGIMAFWPQLTHSNTLEIPPLVTKGFGADFDGDAMQFHVPASADAVEEAKTRLLPSSNLLSVQGFDAHYLPQMEYVGGLWNATAKENKLPVRTFRTKKDAMEAYHRGEISADQQVQIVG